MTGLAERRADLAKGAMLNTARVTAAWVKGRLIGLRAAPASTDRTTPMCSMWTVARW